MHSTAFLSKSCPILGRKCGSELEELPAFIEGEADISAAKH
jgi:hypothetical protein